MDRKSAIYTAEAALRHAKSAGDVAGIARAKAMLDALKNSK
jgi:hypothetical protein